MGVQFLLGTAVVFPPNRSKAGNERQTILPFVCSSPLFAFLLAFFLLLLLLLLLPSSSASFRSLFLTATLMSLSLLLNFHLRIYFFLVNLCFGGFVSARPNQRNQRNHVKRKKNSNFPIKGNFLRFPSEQLFPSVLIHSLPPLSFSSLSLSLRSHSLLSLRICFFVVQLPRPIDCADVHHRLHGRTSHHTALLRRGNHDQEIQRKPVIPLHLFSFACFPPFFCFCSCFSSSLCDFLLLLLLLSSFSFLSCFLLL